MSKLTVDMTLEARSVCDHNCVWYAQVLKRTAKYVTLYVAHVGNKRCKVHTDEDGNEYVYPLGQYSMAPVMRAAA